VPALLDPDAALLLVAAGLVAVDEAPEVPALVAAALVLPPIAPVLALLPIPFARAIGGSATKESATQMDAARNGQCKDTLMMQFSVLDEPHLKRLHWFVYSRESSTK
jgi:hypothetical protein